MTLLRNRFRSDGSIRRFSRDYLGTLLQGGSIIRQGGPYWAWYDSFNTDDAAPVAATVAANPGPGTSSFSGSTGSLASGQYNDAAAGTPAGVYNATGGARAGLAMVVYNVSYSVLTSAAIGFAANTTFSTSSQRPGLNITASLVQTDGTTAMTLFGTQPFSLNTEYDICVLADSTGGFTFYRLSGSTTWTLLGVTRFDTTATIFPFFKFTTATGYGKAIGLAVGVPMPTKYPFASSGVQGVMTLTAADFFAAMRLTSTATNGLKFRRDGSGNYFLAQRTNAGQLNLTRYDASSPTSIVNNAMTAAANDRIYLRMLGNAERLAGHPTGGTWVNGTTQTITQYTSNLGVEVLDETAYDSLEIYPLTGHALVLPARPD